VAGEGGSRAGPTDVVQATSRALRSHDERLADYLDEHRVQLTRQDPHMPSRLHGLRPWLQGAWHPVTPEFAAAIGVRVVTSASSPWWETYALAQAALLVVYGKPVTVKEDTLSVTAPSNGYEIRVEGGHSRTRQHRQRRAAAGRSLGR
jgi:hypothetical protein